MPAPYLQPSWSPHSRRRPRAAASGEGDERPGGGATLRVTRDFGHRELGSVELDSVREGQTVMRMLRSDFDVTTRFGGRFVQSIDGIEGQGAGGQVDWFYWVNGLEADKGAAEWEVSARRPRPVGPPRLERRPCASRRSSAPTPSRSPTASRASGGPVRVECERGGLIRLHRCARAAQRRGRVHVGGVARRAGHRGRDAARGGTLAGGPHRARRVRARGRARGHRRVRPLHERRKDARAARRGGRDGAARAAWRRRGARARHAAARRGAGLDRDRPSTTRAWRPACARSTSASCATPSRSP